MVSTGSNYQLMVMTGYLAGRVTIGSGRPISCVIVSSSLQLVCIIVYSEMQSISLDSILIVIENNCPFVKGFFV